MPFLYDDKPDKPKEKQVHARLNNCTLIGALQTSPYVVKDEDTDELRMATARIWVCRSSRDNTRQEKTVVYEPVSIASNDPVIVKEMSTWKTGDAVQVFGPVSTKKAVKSCNCPNCYHTNYKNGIMTYILPSTAYCVRRLGDFDLAKGFISQLHNQMENSNRAIGVGTLLKEPAFRIETYGKHMVQFPIKITRKFYNSLDDPSERADFPYVKAYDETADYNFAKLKQYSVILYDGFLQTRLVKRWDICEACAERFSWSDQVLEIVPYENSIEYLSGERDEAETKRILKEKDLNNGSRDKWLTLESDIFNR